MKLALVIAAISLPCAASATTVHMKCQLDRGADKSPFYVQLNEAAGIVSWSYPSGTPYSERAAFTAKSISFSNFVIDRTNLTVQRIVFKRPPVDHGKCWPNMDETGRSTLKPS